MRGYTERLNRSGNATLSSHSLLSALSLTYGYRPVGVESLGVLPHDTKRAADLDSPELPLVDETRYGAKMTP